MKVSKEGIDLIQQFEGCRLTAYKCPADVWTIGYGHTGPEVQEGQQITRLQAEDLLRADLEKFERAVRKLLPDVMLTQSEFDALVSFVFNVGITAFAQSTLRKYLLKGESAMAAEQILRWDKVGGKKSNGLARRRRAEFDLFLAD